MDNSAGTNDYSSDAATAGEATSSDRDELATPPTPEAGAANWHVGTPTPDPSAATALERGTKPAAPSSRLATMADLDRVAGDLDRIDATLAELDAN